MSLILEALRKMEQERKSKLGAAQNLRPEVLRYRSAGGIVQQSAKYPLVIIAAVLLLAGIGAGIMLKVNDGKMAAPANQVSAPVAPAPAPVILDAPAVLSPEAPALSGAAPDSESEPVAAPVAVEPAQPKPGPAVAAPAILAPVATGASTQAQPAQRETAEESRHADISISGIAYQDERRMRRAVLNGQLVGEGAEIAGSRVIEIRENKVRLSRGGRVFELFLSSSFSTR